MESEYHQLVEQLWKKKLSFKRKTRLPLPRPIIDFALEVGVITGPQVFKAPSEHEEVHRRLHDLPNVLESASEDPAYHDSSKAGLILNLMNGYTNYLKNHSIGKTEQEQHVKSYAFFRELHEIFTGKINRALWYKPEDLKKISQTKDAMEEALKSFAEVHELGKTAYLRKKPDFMEYPSIISESGIKHWLQK